MPDLVPPEIENLRDCATRPDGGSLTQFEAFIPLADAEAAVLACEKRMGDEQRCPVCAAPEGTWPSQSAQHAVLLEQVKTVRAETVAEIVEALREHDGRKPLGGAWVNSWARNAVADWIESRFAAKKGEDDGDQR